jgi:4-hydroxyphenylpyruvate dioxygenase
MGDHHVKHGDGVRDVAFTCDDTAGIFKKCIERGATAVQEPTTLEDENGKVIVASVKTYGDTIHSFIQRVDYNGVFLPGYKESPLNECLNKMLPIPDLKAIDHCVGNQPDGEMEPVAQWYEKMLDFHRFWSVDDKQINTKYSALRSVVMADFDEKIKMPINEPADGLKKSQITEFCEFYGGPGVQHIAMRTENIIETVERMMARGVKFLQKIPDTYYDNLRKGLAKAGTKVAEDIDTI